MPTQNEMGVFFFSSNMSNSFTIFQSFSVNDTCTSGNGILFLFYSIVICLTCFFPPVFCCFRFRRDVFPYIFGACSLFLHQAGTRSYLQRKNTNDESWDRHAFLFKYFIFFLFFSLLFGTLKKSRAFVANKKRTTTQRMRERESELSECKLKSIWKSFNVHLPAISFVKMENLFPFTKNMFGHNFYFSISFSCTLLTAPSLPFLFVCLNSLEKSTKNTQILYFSR